MKVAEARPARDAKAQAKLIVAQGLVVIGAGIAFVFLAGLARILWASLSGAAVDQALNELPDLPPGADSAVIWSPDAWDGGRALDTSTRRDIEAAYLNAWGALERYPQTGDVETVVQWWGADARAEVLAQPIGGERVAWGIRHELRLTFLSLDGSTVTFEAQSEIARLLAGPDDTAMSLARERNAVVMTLEDGYWRIRQLRRDEVSPATSVSLAGATGATGAREWVPTVTTGVDPGSDAGVTRARGPAPIVADTALPLTAAVASPAGPEPGGARLNRAVWARILADARDSGVGVLRVVVPATRTGPESAEPEASHAAAIVRQALDDAGLAGLAVQVVVDGPGTSRPADSWVAADHRLRTVVSTVAGHAALHSIDVYDAPETALATPPVELRAWLVHAVSTARAADLGAPVTIGWRSVEGAGDPGLFPMVDVVTVPHDATGPAAEAAVRGWSQATGRPVALTTSLHSWNGWGPGGRTEAEHAESLSASVRHADAAGAVAIRIGALRDAPTSHAERVVASIGRSAHTGVLRLDGSPKPAADAMLAHRDGREWIPSAGPVEFLSKPFTWCVITIQVACAAAWIAPRRHTRAPARAGTSDRPASLDSVAAIEHPP